MTRRGIEWFLEKRGSWKILAQSQNLRSEENKGWFLGDEEQESQERKGYSLGEKEVRGTQERQGWHFWEKRVEPGRTEWGAVVSTGFNKRVGSRWGEEGENKKVSMSRQGKRYISDDVIDRIYKLHPEADDPYRRKERPSSEELTKWMQENEVIKLTIKQKFKAVVRKDVKTLHPPAMSVIKRLSMHLEIS